MLKMFSSWKFCYRFVGSLSWPGPGWPNGFGRLTMSTASKVKHPVVPLSCQMAADDTFDQISMGTYLISKRNKHIMYAVSKTEFIKRQCQWPNQLSKSKDARLMVQHTCNCVSSASTNSLINIGQKPVNVILYRYLKTSTHAKDLEKDKQRGIINVQKTKEKVRDVKDSVEETVKEWKEDVLTVPNALTASRIVLAPIIGYMVLNDSYFLACGFFVFAGVTDLLDGWIARKYPSQASVFGSFMDPLADKLLVSILFLSLTAVNLIPVALTCLIILRDVILVGAAFYIRYMTLPPPKTISRYFDVTHATAQLHPTFISKLNTAVQLVLVAASLGAPVCGYVDHVALQSLWYLTAGTTIASGITYMFAKNTFRILRESKKQKK